MKDKNFHNGNHSILKHENYDSFGLNKKLLMNLRDLGHTIRSLYEGRGSQKQALILLHESGNMTQRELTMRMGIQPGSASEVIGKLENAGMIVRKPSENDRRTVDIRLTEEGRKKAGEAAGQRKKRHEEMFSCLSDKEKETLLKLTEKLNTDWDSRYRDKQQKAAECEGRHHEKQQKDAEREGRHHDH